MSNTRDFSLGERIRFYRKKNGFTQQELADYLGLQKAVISKYENGIVTNIKKDTLKKMAVLFGIEPWELQWGEVIWAEEDDREIVNLFNNSDMPNIETKHHVRVPILGHVAAGIPIEQIEDIEGYEDIRAPVDAKRSYFALRIRGDSMQPLICDGSIVIVHKQEDAETGEIVIAAVNGDDATCKRLKKYPGGIMLLPINPSYDPMVFGKNDIKSFPVQILGKVIEVRTTL